MRALLIATCLLALPGCRFDVLERCTSAEAGDRLSCATPGELDRAYDIDIPANWDGISALPVIYAFHGGGGRRASAEALTCPGGDTDHPDCLSAKARALGYAVVRPDGTGGRPYRNLRTWNGGGGGEWACTSGAACASGVDDMAYLDKVHGEILAMLPVDESRVFATGLSNGGTISHRLACERAQRFAAIAAVGGANQFAAAGGLCEGNVSVLQIHGTEDPIWKYETSSDGGVVQDGKLRVGAEDSTEAWASANGCSDETSSQVLPDLQDDGTRSERLRWQDCERATELIRIDGGGHTWPQGDPYLSEERVGRVAQDFDADDVILEFFGDNAR